MSRTSIFKRLCGAIRRSIQIRGRSTSSIILFPYWRLISIGNVISKPTSFDTTLWARPVPRDSSHTVAACSWTLRLASTNSLASIHLSISFAVAYQTQRCAVSPFNAISQTPVLPSLCDGPGASCSFCTCVWLLHAGHPGQEIFHINTTRFLDQQHDFLTRFAMSVTDRPPVTSKPLRSLTLARSLHQAPALAVIAPSPVRYKPLSPAVRRMPPFPAGTVRGASFVPVDFARPGCPASTIPTCNHSVCSV